MIFTPKPHQWLGINHLLANDHGILLAGMGLGKTAMVLAALDQLIADGASTGALIIAPLRVSLFTWRDEMATWSNLQLVRVLSLRTPEGQDAWKRGEGCIYTLNYEGMFSPVRMKPGQKKPKSAVPTTGLLPDLMKHGCPVDTLVWDELSKAKDPSGTRIRGAMKFRDRFKRHWGLTGTPTPNSMLDLFAQCRLIDGGKRFGTSMQGFKDRFFRPEGYVSQGGRLVPKAWVLRPECEGMIERIMGDFALTLRSEDYLDIPPVEVVDVPVTLPTDAKKAYKKLEKDMLIQLSKRDVVAVNRAVLVGKLQQMVGGAVYSSEDEVTVVPVHNAKVEALAKLHDREGRKPMLVAVRYRHEIDRILKGIPYARAFSSEMIEPWNTGKVPMLVAHPASMSHGLNLQHGGSRVCWFTPTYSSEEYDQMNARVARTGQKAESKIFRLIAGGTIDEAVVAAMESKIDGQSALLAAVANLQTLARV